MQKVAALKNKMKRDYQERSSNINKQSHADGVSPAGNQLVIRIPPRNEAANQIGFILGGNPILT
jgi:hypothetical protein